MAAEVASAASAEVVMTRKVEQTGHRAKKVAHQKAVKVAVVVDLVVSGDVMRAVRQRAVKVAVVEDLVAAAVVSEDVRKVVRQRAERVAVVEDSQASEEVSKAVHLPQISE